MVKHYFKCPSCHEWMEPMEIPDGGTALILRCNTCGDTFKSVGDPRLHRFKGRDGILSFRSYPDDEGNMCHKVTPRIIRESIEYYTKSGKRVEIIAGNEPTYRAGKRRYEVTVKFVIDAPPGIDPDGISTMLGGGWLEFYDQNGKSIATMDNIASHETICAGYIGGEMVFVCEECKGLFAMEEAYQRKNGDLICPTCWMKIMKSKGC